MILAEIFVTTNKIIRFALSNCQRTYLTLRMPDGTAEQFLHFSHIFWPLNREYHWKKLVRLLMVASLIYGSVLICLTPKLIIICAKQLNFVQKLCEQLSHFGVKTILPLIQKEAIGVPKEQ